MSESKPGGRTRWLHFTVILGAALSAAAVLVFGLSQGAFAASFAVSGTSFKISADKLKGTGFVQFGGVDQGAGTAHPVAVSAFRTVVLDNFCQSATLHDLPVVGDVTLRMTSAGPDGMSPENIVLGVEFLSGDLTMVNPQIGVDAAHVSKGPPDVTGAPGGFAQQADQATIVMPGEVAWSVGAHTLRLRNLELTLHRGSGECH